MSDEPWCEECECGCDEACDCNALGFCEVCSETCWAYMEDVEDD